MSLPNPEALAARADLLAAQNLNGLRRVLVSIVPATALDPQHALLDVWFHNELRVAPADPASVLAYIAGGADAAERLARTQVVFALRGGHRLRAGRATGEVQVTSAVAGPAANRLTLRVEPVGDYSTYTLEVVFAGIDPLFASVGFKFRPGCFNHDCDPDWTKSDAPLPSPPIDYLAKDYDSFRHTLINAMSQRVPGWKPTSEADLDHTLLSLFAAAADELSDFQDRVVGEAYLTRCRSRISLARHCRLVDYHVHQGNQASPWLALEVGALPAAYVLSPRRTFWAGREERDEESVVFATREPQRLDPLLNTLRLYPWGDAITGLAAGTTTADLLPDAVPADQAAAEAVRDLILDGTIRRLLIQEHLNPLTGRVPGRDPEKRQLVELVTGTPATPAAEALQDPFTGQWFVRVRWRREDALRAAYCCIVNLTTGRVADVSLFHGNLVRTHHGLPVETRFHPRGVELPLESPASRHRHSEPQLRYGEERGTLCPLPREHAPLAYLSTPVGGIVPPRSTITLTVQPTGAGESAPWTEVSSLVHSRAGETDFVVETDEQQRSFIRLGDGTNGADLEPDSVVICRYQVGGGTAGHVGRDAITRFTPSTAADLHPVTRCWNPFDVTDGADAEPVERIVRAAPEAFRARQLRAVTLEDYRRRAEAVPGVQRAHARYHWTGSWRTVRVVIDPIGTTVLPLTLRDEVAAQLEAVRLIGEDLELRAPRYVPLVIEIVACVHPEVWPEDVRAVLEQEFSDAWTPDGRRGFFHPDAWSFGQALHRSQLAGRVHEVAGIDRILAIRLRRFNEPTPGDLEPVVLTFAAEEILQVANDPDHRERGAITFTLGGGRR